MGTYWGTNRGGDEYFGEDQSEERWMDDASYRLKMVPCQRGMGC